MLDPASSTLHDPRSGDIRMNDRINNGTPRNPRRSLGLTLVEVASCTAMTTIVMALFIVMFGVGRSDRLRSHSGSNLSMLVQGMYTYAADWEGRQWTKVPDEMSDYDGDIDTYNDQVRCVESMILGTDSQGLVWGWWMNGYLCSSSSPGSSNEQTFDQLFQPYSIMGDFEFYRDTDGAHSLFHTRGFREYVASSLHDGVFYQPGSRDSKLNELMDRSGQEFFGPYFRKGSGSSRQFLSKPGYTMSPAAMWSPDVHRASSDGDWRDPRFIDDGYRSPSIVQCVHPDLKTMFVERWWIDGAPSRFHPDSVDPPTGPRSIENVDRYHWSFNQGHASAPLTAFYDGSIAPLTVGDAFHDDRRSRKSSGYGLWSRDSPMGGDGYLGDRGNGDGFSSFHILTVDGIEGRDLLRRRDG